MRDLVRLNANRSVTGVWLDYIDEVDPQTGLELLLVDVPQLPLFDVTGRSDVPNRDYMGRRHNLDTDTFGPPPIDLLAAERSRLTIIKEVATNAKLTVDTLIDLDESSWTILHVARALRVLLRHHRIEQLTKQIGGRQ